jgi:hypothetical protein
MLRTGPAETADHEVRSNSLTWPCVRADASLEAGMFFRDIGEIPRFGLPGIPLMRWFAPRAFTGRFELYTL